MLDRSALDLPNKEVPDEAATTAQLVPPSPPLFDETRQAVSGFLARYSGTTRAGYATDLRAWFSWCADAKLEIFGVRRAHIELFAPWMEEERHLARATVGRRLSTVVGFYRFAVIDGFITESPAEHVRRQKIDTESTTLGLDRMELGAFLAQAAAAGPVDHALACLLGLLGLRVSEACSINIEHLSSERGHRTVKIMGKGGKAAVIPLPPRVGRAIDLAADERTSGPVLLSRSGQRLDRHGATRIVRRVAKKAGISKRISPHSLRHSFITAALDAGVPLRDVQIAARHADPRTTNPLRPGPPQPGPACQLRRFRIRSRRGLTAPPGTFRMVRFPPRPGVDVSVAGRTARVSTPVSASLRVSASLVLAK